MQEYEKNRDLILDSFQININNFGTTMYMFFDVEYFDNNKGNIGNYNPNWNEKPKFFPFQFTLTNYFGPICINEWIAYDKTIMTNKEKEGYEFALKKKNIDYEATCGKHFLNAKIKNNMKEARYLIGYGVEEDVKLMNDRLGIDLERYHILDLSKYPGFAKDNRIGFPEKLKFLTELKLETKIQSISGHHDSRIDCECIRKLFWKEKEKINLSDLIFNKF